VAQERCCGCKVNEAQKIIPKNKKRGESEKEKKTTGGVKREIVAERTLRRGRGGDAGQRCRQKKHLGGEKSLEEYLLKSGFHKGARLRKRGVGEIDGIGGKDPQASQAGGKLDSRREGKKLRKLAGAGGPPKSKKLRKMKRDPQKENKKL